MTFHILGLPHTITSKEFNACAYTQKVLKFGKMMVPRGHEVIHYGHEDSELDCTEHVTCLSREDYAKVYGDHDWNSKFFKFDLNDHAYKTFFANAIREVGLRKKPGDFILPFWGQGGKPVTDAHPDVICVEPGIGYSRGAWAKYKVFESYALMHAYWTTRKCYESCRMDNYEIVIPNYFDLEEFTYQEKKEDYFLFLGRVYRGKGVHIAIEACKEIGARLIVAGQGSIDDLEGNAKGYLGDMSHVDFVGYADIETRKSLMANAKGVFMPSQYVEPFGGVQVESMLSGTPVISSDWGAFSEVNIHGVTGYRCRTFNDYCKAAENIERINPLNCRKHGEAFSLETIAPRYEKFFQDVLHIHGGKGWYEIHDKGVEEFLAAPDPLSAPPRCDFASIEEEERPMAVSIAKWLKKQGAAGVDDIGAGPGIYTEECHKVNVQATAYDIDPRGQVVSPLDITKSVIPGPHPYALCLEVAEHIPEVHAEAVVANIAKGSPRTIIWSAAAPGQGGIGHINCQPQSYWIEKFSQHGYVPCEETRQSLLDAVKQGVYMGWFEQNLIVFRPDLD